MADKSKILIVEDDQFIREFYADLLIGEGYIVDTAIDGEIALTKIRQGGWGVILLDIMLPKIDGLQILKELKAQPAASSNGPIIVLTNLGNNTIINQAFNLGAAGYLIKSAMNPEEILKEITNFLPKQ